MTLIAFMASNPPVCTAIRTLQRPIRTQEKHHRADDQARRSDHVTYVDRAIQKRPCWRETAVAIVRSQWKHDRKTVTGDHKRLDKHVLRKRTQAQPFGYASHSQQQDAAHDQARMSHPPATNCFL